MSSMLNKATLIETLMFAPQNFDDEDSFVESDILIRKKLQTFRVKALFGGINQKENQV